MQLIRVAGLLRSVVARVGCDKLFRLDTVPTQAPVARMLPHAADQRSRQ